MQHEEVNYELPEYQYNFICNNDLRIATIVGAKGSSKTWSGARFAATQVADAHERGVREQGLIMLNSRQQVYDVFEQDIRPLFDELGWPYTFNAQTLNLTVLTTRIHLRSADPDAVKKIESIVYEWGWADEASYYPPETLRTFVSRIRKGKALVRITSMPDEPDAYIYSFVEKLAAEEKAVGGDGALYEITLADNPDVEFRTRYEAILRATYSGAQLDRFLYGKRVSLAGSGMFAVEPEMRTDIQLDPNSDVYLVWDFNVEYRAVSAWQQIGYSPEAVPRYGCVRSWQMKEETVEADAQVLSEIFKNHNAPVYLHGDASGDNRTAQVTISMWKTVRGVFQAQIKDCRYIVPNSNPPVKDTIQCLNWALKANLIEFNAEEKNVFRSLQACRADKFGELDKSIDYTEGTSSRTHEADTARYAAFHFYRFIYPGGANQFYVV